ncbi:NAD(P)H-dependent oxidoreductase [Undibacterium jejuense]|uniref:FMN dependent NADH:quinone oxidoreductase n=1 Tax=Undibacterium jejuense TaxID=1344949 RepID=A0A923HIM5_9BURK|nr:NAD(P)H-dependent oxidoreductase [Undibacterium jejuense]MBC3862865.1 NAD(P)H-dependent oxidoreductase [Undibacterium jejuense]
MNILQINSSVRASASHSKHLNQVIVERVLSAHPEANIVSRDLAQTPQPVLDEQALQALFTPADQRNAEQQARVALDDALIAEIQAANVIVIGAPMYNFGVSAQLKNWVDAIARAGVTFRYGQNGPEGLLTGKKVYVVLTRGGMYRNTPNDSQMPYLKSVFGFLGMTDISFIYAEGLAMGPDAEAAALASAKQQIEELVSA